jgi:hypothetical protein
MANGSAAVGFSRSTRFPALYSVSQLISRNIKLPMFKTRNCIFTSPATVFRVTALCDVMPCSLIDWYKCFGGTCCLHVQHVDPSFSPEDGGTRFFVIVVSNLANYTSSYPRRQL